MSQESAQPDARPIVIVGAGGMLGTAWANLLTSQARRFEPTTRATLDLGKPESFSIIAKLKPAAVVNCAGYTRVDDAEANEAEARLVNAIGPGLLAKACADAGVPLIHYSTDYVFEGNASAPYSVDAATGPLNAYGRTKLEGEAMIRQAGGPHLILRTSWLYAPWGVNFVRTIAGKANSVPVLKVVHDQRGRPTSAQHLASASLRLLDLGHTGTFHVTDSGHCTWFELAREIVRLIGAPCPVEPCTTADVPRPARRPSFSVLALDRTEAILGPMPAWQDNLRAVIGVLNTPKGAPS